MKKPHNIILPLILLIILCVFAACGRSNNSDDMRKLRGQQQVLSKQDDITDSPSPSSAPKSATFLVRLESSTLTLYDTRDEEPFVIKSININTSYYPPEDISALNAGIGAYSKEEGFEILENFTN